MTKDEIIEMAKQCGLPLTYVPHDNDTFSPHVDGLVAFAALVSARAAAIEREACAEVCDQTQTAYTIRNIGHAAMASYYCASAIRERGDQHE